MTIEFRCTQCHKLLRTPDGTAGKKAKCPQCGAVVAIPVATDELASEASTVPAPSPAPSVPKPQPQPQSQNPFQSPAGTESHLAPPGEVRRGFQPTRIDIADVMGRAWLIYKNRLGPCLLAMFVYFIAIVAVSGALGFAARNAGGFVNVSIGLMQYVFGIFLYLGLMGFMLKTARGEKAEVSDLFGAGPLVLRGLGVMVLYMLAYAIGLVLLIIPGIIVLFMFSQAIFVLIDQGTGVIDSLRYSAQATKGNKLTLFALGVIGSLLGMLGMCALFVGIFFVMPYIVLLQAVVYLRMTGQSTADEPTVPAAL
jgi:phage FluMu protein Com